MSPRHNNPSLLRQCSALAALVFAAGRAAANPAGMTVAAGSATAVQNGSQLNITASQNAVLNWQSFNIAAGETTTFQQPNNVSVVWNRIADANPSQIWGHLNANGIVVLMNQNGFYFGPNSSVNVGGFIAAGAWVTPPANVGGMWSYQGQPPAASIINYGEIKANNGGSLFLVAEKIENHGMLTAPDGTLGLYAGKQVLISERPDGRGLSANVALPDGAIDNFGKISADAGTIALHAQVVNQDGIIQANSVRNNHGVIELVASDAVNLGANSLIQANGDDSGASSGGQVTVKSANTFADDPASRIEVRGGVNGGNGGAVEISAADMTAVNSQIDGAASAGGRAGSLLLDPDNIYLSSQSGDSASSGTVGVNDLPSTLNLNVNSFASFAQITLQARNNITFANNTKWILDAIPGSSGNLLTLEAGNNIIFGNSAGIKATILAGKNWSVSLAAGVDFSSPTLAVQTGIGGIYLCGLSGSSSGAIQTDNGDITLTAGHEVIVGSGYIRTGYILTSDGRIVVDNTAPGGNIFITTGDGDVNSGTKATTLDFGSSGYIVSLLSLGGIATAHGGNVTINAGQDILSDYVSPLLNYCSIGAFGAGGIDDSGNPLGDATPGNVSLTAGRDIVGSFMVVNGAGTVLAGRDVGYGSSSASFGLVKGGWTIKAGWDAVSQTVMKGQGNIYLNEVYNPNGSQNANNAGYGAGVPFQFDYASDAYVDLVSGNSVQLMGDHLKYDDQNNNSARPPIYAPILKIATGAGGVTLANDVVLYPSPLGALSITTTDGGSLQSSGQDSSGYANVRRMVVSDSGRPEYTDFIGGHAPVPVHQGQTTPVVQLTIDGNLHNVFIRSPGMADIQAAGSALNFSFEGQNLSANDITKINIAGDFINRGDPTSITWMSLGDSPSAALYNQIFNDPIFSAVQFLDPHLFGRVYYNAATHQIGFQGIMTAADLNFLLNPRINLWEPLTGQAYDAQGNPITVPVNFTADATALNNLQYATADIPKDNSGLQLGGQGTFQISARNMDLGTSPGIRTVGTLFNFNLFTPDLQHPAEAAYSARSASIELTLGGDLKMTSSTIASFSGGSIDVQGAGRMDLGSQNTFSTDSTPRGIYTGHGGDVIVHAVGDINVNGSRLGSYDGGNVTVISDAGQVDAGNGGNGFFRITTSQVVDGQLQYENDQFYGSGIVALTGKNSLKQVGNIDIQAAGDISANQGGVLQFGFNPAVSQSQAKVVLSSTGGSIHAGQSGVLGASDVTLNAPGGIDGFVVAVSGNLNVHAQGGVNVTAFAGGAANVSGSTVSGIVVSGGDATVTGSEWVTASVISTGGSANGAQGSAFAGVAAPAAQKTTDDAEKTVASNTATTDDQDELKKRAASKGAVLAQKVSRVTVILPKKS